MTVLETAPFVLTAGRAAVMPLSFAAATMLSSFHAPGSPSTLVVPGVIAIQLPICIDRDDLRPNIVVDATARATRALAAAPDGSAVRQARSFLPELQRTLTTLALRELPELRATDATDDAYKLEWRFPDRRLVFVFEADPEQSGWHYVSSIASGDVRASGGFFGIDMRAVLSLLRR